MVEYATVLTNDAALGYGAFMIESAYGEKRG
jgi:hypothetical protein